MQLRIEVPGVAGGKRAGVEACLTDFMRQPYSA
jgi:hypothetical protein